MMHGQKNIKPRIVFTVRYEMNFYKKI